MTFLCLSGILGSAADKMPVTPIREAAGFVIIPFQNGINQIGAYLTDRFPERQKTVCRERGA